MGQAPLPPRASFNRRVGALPTSHASRLSLMSTSSGPLCVCPARPRPGADDAVKDQNEQTVKLLLVCFLPLVHLPCFSGRNPSAFHTSTRRVRISYKLRPSFFKTFPDLPIITNSTCVRSLGGWRGPKRASGQGQDERDGPVSLAPPTANPFEVPSAPTSPLGQRVAVVPVFPLRGWWC